METPSKDDIAIVGVACRFPGEANSPTGLLSMLRSGRDAWTKIPKDRFDIDAYHHPSNERQGSVIAQGGYFIEEDPGRWDAPFFSMTPAEANAMDPQQRLLLEVAYEGLENAGIPMESVVGSETSVYVGCFTKDYEGITCRETDAMTLYQATGQGLAMLSNRLSWFYDLKGPSLTLDTACSSSLLALHLACQSIRNGESKMSIVGGTGLILFPDIMRTLTALHFLSPDSRCFSFDERANGYARGEGLSAVILKPVEDALRDGDTIRAVIRASATNQDGRTPGITLPSTEAQATLIRTAYKNANLPYADTQYFEAHGTGTPAGDPLELGALGATFGSEAVNEDSKPLYVGSVKTNIGHLEGCAGLAGLLKAVLSLESGLIFPSLNYEKPNPRILLKEWNLSIPTELTPWPTDGLRRASVNSFGYGGSNVHVIIDDAHNYLAARGLTGFTHTKPEIPSLIPAVDSDADTDEEHVAVLPTPPEVTEDRLQLEQFPHKRLFVLSAPDQAAVTRLGATYADYIDQSDTSKGQLAFLESLSHTLCNRRSQFPWRQGVVAATLDQLAAGLREVKALRLRKTPQIAFVFTGQGAQWVGMGKQLMSHQVFSASVSAADAHLRSLGSSWSVKAELDASEADSRLNQAEFSQPLCTVLQVALVDLLSHWGLKPSAVVGHSSGEIAAAYAAGSLSAKDAWKVAYFRGRAAVRVAKVAPELRGGMLAAGLSQADAQAYIDKLEGPSVAVVACINSGKSVTISGDVAALDVLEEKLKADDVFARRLKVDRAYHSPHMEHVAEEYRSSIADIVANETTCAFVSSVTGAKIDGAELDAKYWVKNMTAPVNFFGAVDSMIPDAKARRRQKNKDAAVAMDTFVEVGPAGALQGPLKQIFSGKSKPETLTGLSVLARGTDAVDSALEAVCKLWTMGVKGLDFTSINSEKAQTSAVRTLVDLPSYPWNHSTRYWHETDVSRNHRSPRAPRLDLLGRPVDDWNPAEPRWKNFLRVSEQPWILDHKVQNSIIYPAAGFICGVLEGARQIWDDSKTPRQFELRDITIGRALEFDGETDVVELVIAFKSRKLGLRARDAPWIEWTAYSNSDKGHIEHCSGLLQVKYEQAASEIEGGREELARWQQLVDRYHDASSNSTKVVPGPTLYSNLTKIGLQYGPLFQGIQEAKTGVPGVGCSTIAITDTKAAMPMEYEYDHLIHPSTLDACFQSVFTALPASAKPSAMVPTQINSIRISAAMPKGAGTTMRGFSTAERLGFRSAVGTIVMSSQEWDAPLVEVDGFTCTELGALTGGQAAAGDATVSRKVVTHIGWEADSQMLSRTGAKLSERIMELPDEDPRRERWIRAPAELAAFTERGEKMAAIYAKRGLASLTSEVEAKLPSHLVHYVAWLRDRHGKAVKGALEHQHGSPAWMQMSEAAEDEFLDEFITTGIDGELLSAIGRNMPAILDGSVTPLSVMMEDGMLFRYYAEAFGSDILATCMQMTFSNRGHKHPKQRILEIGAGTGGSSLPILQGLGGQDGTTTKASKFVFTDISSGFFENAEKLLRPWANICEFKRLDIEQDPVEQGYEAESFDVITATNVLHATKNLDVTLQNVKKLLKPNGQLVLGEITNPRDRISTIMGTLPGWWLSEDGRQGGPCITEKQWQEAFERNGFAFDYFAADTEDALSHTSSLMCGTKRVEDASLPFEKAVIVDDGKASESLKALSANLKARLAKMGVEAELLSIDEAAKLEEDVAVAVQGKTVISLLEAETPFLVSLSERQFKDVQRLIVDSASTIWITRGGKLTQSEPNFRLADGMFRVIGNEESTNNLRRLDLDMSLALEAEATSGFIVDSFDIMFPQGDAMPETEIAVSKNQFMIPRLYDHQPKDYDLRMLSQTRAPEEQPLHQKDRPLRASIGVPGMLDTLHWVDEDRVLDDLPPTEVEIDTKATALNFVDIMVAMGIVPDVLLGCDSAGVVARVGSAVTGLKVGDRVAAVGAGAYTTRFRLDQGLCQPIPDSLSFEDAASLPVVYTTAYQSLVEIGRLAKGESILIHAAAGGLGQAAIQLAQYIGADIFVTVGSLAKKQLLVDNYNIPEDRIFNSRDLTFAQGVLRSTGGKGVDVILNSLAGEALRMTWSCIKPFGRFIEVGKKDILGNTGLEMMPFLRNVTFAGVNVEHMLRHSIDRTAVVLEKAFKLIRAGHLKTVKPVVVYDVSEMERAFRLMQQGRHTGKIILSLQDEKAVVPVIPRDPHPVNLSPSSTYLLVGGLGGLGRAQALWFAQHGARNLAFISRSGAASAAAKETMEKLTELGVTAKAYACDVANEKSLADTLSTIGKELPPIKGVLQGAMVLSDVFYRNMTFEQWTAAIRPKVAGSWNLHTLLPRDLDFFVMLSSLAGLSGSRGQSNYGAGNSYEDALAHYRRAHGLPATTIDLGIIGGFGFVEENRDQLHSYSNLVAKLEDLVVQPHEFYSILKSAITGYAEGERQLPAQTVCGTGTGGMIAAANLDPGEWYWYDDVLFAFVAHLDTLNAASAGGESDSQLQAALAAATSMAEGTALVQEAVMSKLAKAMMIPPEDIDPAKPISSYGVDSLVAVEMRNWIAREVKSDLSVFEIMSPVPMTQLITKVVSKSALLAAELHAEAAELSGSNAAAGAAAAGDAAPAAAAAPAAPTPA